MAGILGSTGSVLNNLRIVTQIIPAIGAFVSLFETTGENKVGAEKKEAVEEGIAQILGDFIGGWLAKFISWAIDKVVGLKNKSGEFTHSDKS